MSAQVRSRLFYNRMTPADFVMYQALVLSGLIGTVKASEYYTKLVQMYPNADIVWRIRDGELLPRLGVVQNNVDTEPKPKPG